MSARVCPLTECALCARLSPVRVKTQRSSPQESYSTDVLFMSGSLRHSALQKQGIPYLPTHSSRAESRTT
ncbi:rCG28768, isoform CRA_b [Rattus norvegicus]|uniref:RCG28768, isoform CRA_b n=1 Tax=Rattus norvegicus TaxID=10116 RepID=A6HVE6_RAT|nr:rCG28768, isoform CRA_b [Rattus norvegicus]